MAKPTRVLVIDDDVTVRLLMRSALRSAGFETVLAEGGHAGLARFAEGGADMVLLDVEMPDLGGLEVCRLLRAQAGALLPIVMVTGMDDVDSVEQAYGAGATDFIVKPINWPLFSHRVHYLLRSAHAMAELKSMHARNAALLDAFPDLLLRLDDAGQVLDVRQGCAGGDVRVAPQAGTALSTHFPAAVAERLGRRLKRAVETGAVQDTHFALLDDGQKQRHYETRIAPIDGGEALCLVRDITSRTEAQAALARSESRLEQAQALARMGSWHVHLQTQAVEWSDQTYRIFGVPEGSPVSSDLFFALLHGEDRDKVRQTWAQAIRAGQSFACEYRIRTGANVVWVQEHGELEYGEDGRVRAVFGTVQDITERKAAEDRIARLAFFDSLTGLPNRASFLDRLDREVRRARGAGTRFALLFMDLDGFKAVNDTLGHHTGDRLLQEAADRLLQVLRPTDAVSRPGAESVAPELARLGGDEFTALLLDLDEPGDALAAGQRILAAMRRPFLIDGRELALSSSLGIAVFPDDGDDAATLLKHADTAMYHAKELGRDNCQFYGAQLTQRAMQRMNMARDLRHALERQEFHLAFQPQLAVGSGRIVAAEALIRWNHPQLGPIAPAAFIGLAEGNSLIVPIGRWVLHEACSAAARWRDGGRALRLAVNVSPVQLKDAGLVRDVLDALAQRGLAPHQLELEIAEGALLEHDATTRSTLQALHAAGVRLALDDFGTGHSPMGDLRRLPVRTLKIDRSFVAGLPQDRDSEAIVRAIASMARSLGLELIAEGVETASQAALLTRIGCDLLQGFHIGRPMAAPQFATWLAASVTKPASGRAATVMA